MLYHLFDWLQANFPFPGAGVFRYITFRAVLAAIFSLLISLVFGGRIIAMLKRRLIGETIREVGPESHKAKKGTPTMGGLIIIAAILIPTLLWGDLTNAYVVLAVVATLWMGVVGFTDDYIKVFRKDKAGLKGKFKIVGQVVLGLIVGLTMVLHPDFQGSRAHVNPDGSIRPNLTLRDAGFTDGDRLLRAGYSIANGHAYDSLGTIRYDNSRAYTSYEVLRPVLSGVPDTTQVARVVVRSSAARRVADELFGTTEAGFATKTNVPFLKDTEFHYGWLAFWSDDRGGTWAKVIYVLMAVFIVTAVSNGVNITDGLDGLAAGTTAIVTATLGIFAYLSGNILFARYLNITFIPYSGELLIFCAAMLGACVGFLWYNTYPAQVFMGDTGSLALGGAVGVLALMVKKELLVPLICGVYFIESLSVIIQVSYFKYTKRKYGAGRRIFRMSPLHHHFELGGLHESKIVMRFMIVTILLEIIAFSTLKLR